MNNIKNLESMSAGIILHEGVASGDIISKDVELSNSLGLYVGASINKDLSIGIAAYQVTSNGLESYLTTTNDYYEKSKDQHVEIFGTYKQFKFTGEYINQSKVVGFNQTVPTFWNNMLASYPAGGTPAESTMDTTTFKLSGEYSLKSGLTPFLDISSVGYSYSQYGLNRDMGSDELIANIGVKYDF